MSRVLIGLYDGVAETFVSISPSRSVMTARRELADWMRSPQFPLRKNVKDYSLWKLGEWNEQTGELTSAKEFLVLLSDVEVSNEGQE